MKSNVESLPEKPRSVVRIIPPPPTSSGMIKSQGTRCLIGDVEIPRVTAIRLTARVDDLWRAEIECFAAIDEIALPHTSIVFCRLGFWGRLRAAWRLLMRKDAK